MKKASLILAVLVSALLTLPSCEKEGAKLYDVTIQVNYPEGYSENPASDVLVTVTNISTANEDTVRTNSEGIAEIRLVQGNYSFSASTESTDFNFNGISQNQFVSPTELNSFSVALEASAKTGGLVISEIYYSGSLTAAGTSYYSDQFVKIYNNSDETIYLDGLCIGILEPTGNDVDVWVDGSGNIQDSLPIKFHALMFPGTGTTYPLAARTSTVLAQDAINHKSDATNGNSNSPVDLGNAPFETYIETSGKDADAAGAANLIVMYTTSTTMYDWLMPVAGGAIVIFRLPTGLDYASYVADTKNFQTKPGSTATTKYFMVYKSDVIDAVEAVNPDAAKRNKRLPNSLDAGMVNCSGTYNSKSIIRKVSMIIDGKLVYKDTNNSTNDFKGDCTPSPFENPTVVDSK
jgi:hypothetical protein